VPLSVTFVTRTAIEFVALLSAHFIASVLSRKYVHIVSRLWRKSTPRSRSVQTVAHDGWNSGCNDRFSRPAPSSRAAPRFVFPEAISKTILARRTSPAGREREFAKLSNWFAQLVSKTNAAFGRPIAIGTPIVHRRCLDSEHMPIIYGTEHQMYESVFGSYRSNRRLA
jgi:hypothetical protein